MEAGSGSAKPVGTVVGREDLKVMRRDAAAIWLGVIGGLGHGGIHSIGLGLKSMTGEVAGRVTPPDSKPSNGGCGDDVRTELWAIWAGSPTGSVSSLV